MDQATKTEIANKVLAEYEKNWGRRVPARILAWWSSGEVWKYDRKCIPAGVNIPGYNGESTFRLLPCIPSWDVLANCNGLDSAISGVDGDWKHAGDFIPLFHVDTHYLAAHITDETCAIGFFEENLWARHGKGYVHGMFMLSASLDAFLGTLVDMDADKAEFETSDYDYTWEEVAEWEEDGDDDDDKE